MVKRKANEDGNSETKKVKRPPTAYNIYVKLLWEQEETKDNYATFSKHCAAKWSNMTVDDKKPYKDEADSLKVKWDQENQSESGSRRRRKGDPNKKKRPPGPYILFCSDMRETVKQSHPNLPVTQIAKLLGKRWNELTDSEKAVYISKAEEGKKRYQEELEAETFVPTH